MDVEPFVAELLKKEQIFGVDLYEAGLAGKVCGYLKELTKGKGQLGKL